MNSDSFLGAEFFRSNRLRLREVFSGTAPIIISGNYLQQKSSDTSYDFTQDSNFWYLTGIDEPGLTLILDGDKEYLIVPSSNPVRSTFEGELDKGELSKISGIKTIYETGEGWRQIGRKITKVKHVATIQPSPNYIESMVMFTSPAKAKTVEKIKEYNSEVDLIDLRKVLASLRSVKQPIELELMKKAISESEKLYKLLEKKRDKVENENELMAEITKALILKNLQFAYTPIIASGKNALTLHYVKNNDALDNKKLLLVDAGVKYQKYCADITRTVVSEPTKRQQAVYNAVIEVQEYAISLLKPGVLLQEYEEKVQNFMGEKLRELGLIKTISKETVREFYPHSTSHFLGIDPHDVGDYSSPLSSGMVLTVEPGIYIKDENIGVRIEDDVLITDEGNEVLTKALIKDITKLAL